MGDSRITFPGKVPDHSLAEVLLEGGSDPSVKCLGLGC